jgi:hypothetical protein
VLGQLQVDLQGIGVSIIEASVTKLAREVMHVQLRRVSALHLEQCDGIKLADIVGSRPVFA